MNNPKYIVLHHSLTEDSDTVSWGAIRKYHMDTLKWSDIGYHVGIEKARDDYEIMLGRMFYNSGAHCKGLNHQSIGICCVGNFDNKIPPPKQWEQTLKVTRLLMQIYKTPKGSIIGHKDMSNKTCPGKMFDMDKFRKEL